MSNKELQIGPVAKEWAEQDEEHLRRLSESAFEGIAIHENGIILETNEKLAELFGYERSELIGKSAIDLTAPESAQLVSLRIRSESEEPYEAIGLRKDGTTFIGEIHARSVPIRNRLLRIATIRDVTQKKRKEKIQDCVYRISEAAHVSQNLNSLFPEIHKIVGELMPVQNFYIALRDTTTGYLTFPYFVDQREAPPSPRKHTRGLTEYVFRTGQALLAPPAVEQELVKTGHVDLFGPPAVDWLGVPLKAKNTIIGVLVVQSYTEGIRFGEEEKNILAFVSTQIAMAIEKKTAEEDLQKSEERYRVFVQHIGEGIWRTEMMAPISIHLPEDIQIAQIYQNSRVAECNDIMARMYGYSSAQELVGLPVQALHTREPHNIEFQRSFVRSGYKMKDAESHEIDRFGNKKYFLNNALGIVKNDFLYAIWGTQRDITDQKMAEEALRDSEERYRMLFERNLAGVFRSTLDGRILDCNISFARILGYNSKEEILSKSAWDLYHQQTDRENFIQRLQKQNAVTNAEICMKRKDGSEVWALENVSLLQTGTGTSIIEGTLVDITDRKNAERQIAYQAYHDALTGLPNRSLFYDRLQQALGHAQRYHAGLAVLFLDLDHFKLINDTLGHSVGDWLLRQASARLKQSLREMDTVARLGGDEFILLLPEIEKSEDAARVAQKILDAVSIPLKYNNNDLYVTTSVGISLSPGDGLDAETLIRCADSAMYRAKELGRNNYQLWSPALNIRVHERLHLERNIRRAIEAREFLLHYQPQWNLESGNICGVEALIRWQHPEKGLVYPKDFMSIAEESRLIIPIGEWLLNEACRQARKWQQEFHPDLRLSLNLSAKQFQQTRLIDLIDTVLDETGFPPDRLVLEIVETVAMQNVDYTLAVLHTLRRKGIRIALDDFGMGYSSLSYLKHFPIDIIKIDPSFVRDVGTGKQEEQLVRAIINLGHSLNQSIIAEGVETELQRQFLKSEGCEEMQGYLLSPPLEASAAERLLDSTSRT